MIVSLKGVLVEKDLARAVVQANGLGYEVLIPMSTYDRLPSPGSEVCLHTYLQVREDGLQLFGFGSEGERRLFVLLIAVSGVGPKLALNVLSCMSTDRFCTAVVNRDVKALSRINGIGRRSAERLVVELQDKAAELAPAAALGGRAGSPGAIPPAQVEDAIAGLIALGFKAEAARRAIHRLLDDADGRKLPADQLVRRALVVLNS